MCPNCAAAEAALEKATGLLRKAQEWAAGYPLQGSGSHADHGAANDVYQSISAFLHPEAKPSAPEGEHDPRFCTQCDRKYGKESDMDDKDRGLYQKFSVTRTNPASAERHKGCSYFVLDQTDDPHAIPALRAYADSCEREYPSLAADIRASLPTPQPEGGEAKRVTEPCGDVTPWRASRQSGPAVCTKEKGHPGAHSDDNDHVWLRRVKPAPRASEPSPRRVVVIGGPTASELVARAQTGPSERHEFDPCFTPPRGIKPGETCHARVGGAKCGKPASDPCHRCPEIQLGRFQCGLGFGHDGNHGCWLVDTPAPEPTSGGER